MAQGPSVGHVYTEPRYHVPHTWQFPTVVDTTAGGAGIGGAASHSNLFRMPFKAKLKKFGVIPCSGTSVICSTTTSFALLTQAGTAIFTWTPGKTTLTKRVATGKTPTTATTIPAKKLVQPVVAELTGSGGSVIFFMDYEETYNPS